MCTPGRIIDLIKQKACSMKRTTFLVLDECDRMFDLGFEPQVRVVTTGAGVALSGASRGGMGNGLGALRLRGRAVHA